MKNIINNLKKSVSLKIQLPLAIKSVSSKDTDKERLMHLKSCNIVTMINDKADQFIEKVFELSFSRYQMDFETSMNCSSFIFDNVHLPNCKSHIINLNCWGSYIVSPD